MPDALEFPTTRPLRPRERSSFSAKETASLKPSPSQPARAKSGASERDNPAQPATEQPRLFRLGDLLGEWESEARAAHEAKTQNIARGPITGFPALDRDLGGVLCPGLHIVHGQPGAGKTAFTLQVATNCGAPCLYVTCEMSPLELLRRHTARATRTFLGRLKSGEMTPEESLALAKRACAFAPQLAMCDATRAYASPRFLRDAALATKGDDPHLLIVVDSLHSWAQGAPTDAPEYETLNAAISGLGQLSRALHCPILIVCERNRGAMSGGGLSAGAGTRKIEYCAETVLDLERDQAKREDAAGEVEVVAKLNKNRHGGTSKRASLQFHGALQSFREV